MITGSALRKLEAQTGLKARKLAVGYCLEVTPGSGYYSWKKDEKEACIELRQQNWHRIQKIVGQRQGHKCFQCGQLLPLSFHHVKFRSAWRRDDGPLDHESNIVGLCQADHQREHGIK